MNYKEQKAIIAELLEHDNQLLYTVMDMTGYFGSLYLERKDKQGDKASIGLDEILTAQPFATIYEASIKRYQQRHPNDNVTIEDFMCGIVALSMSIQRLALKTDLKAEKENIEYDKDEKENDSKKRITDISL